MFPTNFGTHPSALLHFILVPLPHQASHPQILSPVRSLELFRQRPRRRMTSLCSLRCGLTFNARPAAVKPLIIAKHSGSPSTSRSTTASVPFPRHSSIRLQIPWPWPPDPSHSPPHHHPFQETDDVKGKSDSKSYTRESSKILTFLSLPRHTKPCKAPPPESLFVTRNSIRYSHSHLLPHCPLPSRVLADDKEKEASYRVTHQCSSQRSPPLHPLLPPSPPHPSRRALKLSTPEYHTQPRPHLVDRIPADCVSETDDQSSVFSHPFTRMTWTWGAPVHFRLNRTTFDSTWTWIWMCTWKRRLSIR